MTELNEDLARQRDPRDLIADRDDLHFRINRLAVVFFQFKKLEGLDLVVEWRGAGLAVAVNNALRPGHILGRDGGGLERHNPA